MTIVERLRRVAETIRPERQATIGPTGYLDGPVRLTERAAKGVDESGRVYITLCVRAVGRDDRHTYDNTGIVTIFQRWSDAGNNPDIVTQANNTHAAPSLIRSRATDEEMSLIEELVAHGTAARTIEEVAGGTLHEQLTLVDPEPLVAEARRALEEASP